MDHVIAMKKILIAIVFTVSTYHNASAQVQFIAHRGASGDAPENTLAAAKLGWKTGASAVEIDIHLSKDHRLMVIHDDNTKRTTGEAYPIADTPANVLRTLDAGSFKGEAYKGEKIPFLEEVIAAIPEKQGLIIELKCAVEAVPILQQVVTESKKSAQIKFIAFDWETIIATKKAFPDNACYWLCHDKETLAEKWDELYDSQLEGVDLNHAFIDQGLMDKAHALHLEVLAYTINDVAEARRLMALGVKGITTDKPKKLLAQTAP